MDASFVPSEVRSVTAAGARPSDIRMASAHLPAQGGRQVVVELPRLPARRRAADVFVVDEHLRRVDEWVEQFERRVQRWPRRHQLEQVWPFGALGELLLLACGVAGQLRDQDPRGRIRATFTQDEMRREIAGGPVAAQGRGIGSDGSHRVDECGAFTLGCSHTSNMPDVSARPPVRTARRPRLPRREPAPPFARVRRRRRSPGTDSGPHQGPRCVP